MASLSLPSLLGAATGIASNPVSGVVGLVTGLFGAKHDYRPARAAEVLQMVVDNQPYQLLAARIIYKQKTGSHTDAGRQAYTQAWTWLLANKGALAAQAQAAGGLDDPTPGVPNEGTYVPNPVGLTPPAVGVAATSVQQIGASATNQLANAINPGGGYTTIPTDKMTLILLGVGLLVVVFLLMRRRA
jgi:hypothetical protein